MIEGTQYKTTDEMYTTKVTGTGSKMRTRSTYIPEGETFTIVDGDSRNRRVRGHSGEMILIEYNGETLHVFTAALVDSAKKL